MDALKFRVYRVKFPDGGSAFEFKKEGEDRAGGSTETIQLMAIQVKREVNDFLGDADDPVRVVDPFGQVFIDFHPQHDVECRQHISPRRCMPLTEEEKEDFWKTFIKN